jgi:hypothetical protein
MTCYAPLDFTARQIHHECALQAPLAPYRQMMTTSDGISPNASSVAFTPEGMPAKRRL